MGGVYELTGGYERGVKPSLKRVDELRFLGGHTLSAPATARARRLTLSAANSSASPSSACNAFAGPLLSDVDETARSHSASSPAALRATGNAP